MFVTRELPGEEAARSWRQAVLATKAGQPANQTKSTSKAKTSASKIKSFNLNTYKIHALGSYVKAIQEYGTTDSYSTQVVGPNISHVLRILATYVLQGELEHRHVKRFYSRAHKGQNVCSISKQHHHERLLLKLAKKNQKSAITCKKRKYNATKPDVPGNPTVAFNEQEMLPDTNRNAHYHMSADTRHKLNISEWLGEHNGDLAPEVSLVPVSSLIISHVITEFPAPT